MRIKISFELEMSDANMRDWATEYGLDMSEVASDATHHLGELVQEIVTDVPLVKEFASVKNYEVR